jgi:cell division protein FtsI/penicillin-binding protein 2
LPGESAGIVRPLESWAALSKAYVSFGQEVSVTPLQMARALAVVANGGYLVTPHVVRSVMEAGGDRSIAPRVGDRVIDPVVAYELRSMLTGVVEEGTAKLARVEGYGVAGKTGTAQKVIDRRYSQTRFIASFMGMAPLENPRLVGIIVLDEPRPLYHGGQVAAPTFAAIARQVLPYWDLVPDRLAPTEPSFFESISEMQLVELESGPVPLPEEARFGVNDIGPSTLGVSLGEGGR